MANTVLLPPTENQGKPQIALRPIESVSLSGDLSSAEDNVFRSLFNSARDVFFPVQLPPLVLESQPIPVIDRMAVKRSPAATAISTTVNVAILLLVLWFAARQTHIAGQQGQSPQVRATAAQSAQGAPAR
jgi:protein TonB